MKTKNLPIFPLKPYLITVLPVIIIVLALFPSCAAKRKVTTAQTEIAPPSSPPPSNNLKNEVIAEDENTPFVVVEEMPEFPGGDSLLLDIYCPQHKIP